MTQDRVVRGRERRPKGRPLPDPAVKARAEQMIQQGMPYQMAMAVAHGRLDLSEALERMARRDRVQQLMDRHQLSRALATQVALGHANLDVVLARRRLEEHRKSHRDDTCLVPGAELVVVLHDGRTLRGAVRAVDAYQFVFEDLSAAAAGQHHTLHKLLVMFAYRPGDWKGVKKAVKSGDKTADAPAVRPQDRYSLSDRRLFGFQDAAREIGVTLLDGTVVKGVVTWFGRYEFSVRLKTDVEVTVFRHALRGVE
jgi:sRNA-binding regulator protein Hfq